MWLTTTLKLKIWHKKSELPYQIDEKKLTNWLTISGKLVSSSTLVTDTPALSKEDAVPPVETIV